MTIINKKLSLLTFGITSLITSSVMAADRQIEEVVVTAEKIEATVSDTSISITAFSADTIEEFGMQGADDMVNYIPATTRDAYDIRIRGVGRNFRALGGDPGVATYYNGVFSPDFGIAASENALYDIQRVEVLRGPQGTLYGRNAIGGALNYITKNPTFDWTGDARTQFGNYNDQEFYGVLSGPIIEDKLAFRALIVKRDRDGFQEGINGSPDTDSIDDRNYSLALTWNVSDDITVKLRANDRESDRVIGSSSLITEGSSADRGIRSSNDYVNGLTNVSANGYTTVMPGDPGALGFDDPINGGTVYGRHVTPGVNPAAWVVVNGAFNHPETAELMAGASKDDPNRKTNVNDDGSGCSFPYTTANCNHEFFGHRASQNEIVWDVNEDLTLKYIFGTNDFEYDFNIDTDHANSQLAKGRTTVREDVQSKSHEIQIFWQAADNLSITSGVYYFDELRVQDFSLTDSTNRFIQPANYGDLILPNASFGGANVMQVLGLGADHVRLGDAAEGTSISGMWQGDERGDWYHHTNKNRNEATAIYTQATWEINEKFALVLGLRYAEDEKTVREIRGGYFEIPSFGTDAAIAFGGSGPGANAFGIYTPTMANNFGFAGFHTPGITDLAWLNIAMGNATYSGDASNPLTPNCPLTEANCATSLRLLAGIPLSYTSHIPGNDTWRDTNYRVNLDWTPNDDILMYVSVTTGYRSGGFALGIVDARLSDPITGDLELVSYDQEEVTAYEIGYKGLHFDGTLQLNMSLYTYDYENYQDEVNVYDPARGSTVGIVQNADKAVNSGFEVEALWLPTDNLTLGGNFSYTKTKYDSDYFIAVNDDPDHPASLFGNGTTNPELFTLNAKGDQLKRIPEDKYTLWGSYDWPTNVGNFQFRTSYSYTGEFYDAGFESEKDLIPDRFRVDASIMWRSLNDKLSVRGFVNNLTDEDNIRGAGTATESGNWAVTGSVLAPRFYGVDIRYHWGN
jgi:outer membrane receptor protein involved in Fe transport